MFQSAGLNRILQYEIARGNKVRQRSPWPPNIETAVTLKFRFDTACKESGVTFRVLNDPHYWYAEYVSSQSKEMLVCGFSKLKK